MDLGSEMERRSERTVASMVDAISYIQSRREYFAAKDLRSGWSSAESGPCCDRCAMRPEHFNGRADALKALCGCRNPFQLPEVCQCHVPIREAVRHGIVEAHDQLLRKLQTKEANSRVDSFFCENCEHEFTDSPHATDDGYWLCGPCWQSLKNEARNASVESG